MKRFLSIFLCLAMVLTICPIRAYADTAWPENVSIQSEGGIVMDADTGTILYGKNIHETYYPASITKILTALIVIEECELDEMVTFSHNAVYNVEAGSSSAGLDEGDVLSVKDCLYALLLKSANEAGNALAEHVGGTVEGFAEIMNQKAVFLGCQDSNFANPSGLNDPNHYVSAYDMALIGQAALKNKTFAEIISARYYDLPVTKRNPEGARIYPGHKMIKKNMAEYYEGCLGGKTGYTSLAGNTLVTFARRNGMTLVSVVLSGRQTQYTDTRALLNFGFQNFQTVPASGYDTTYASVDNDMTFAGLTTSELSGIQIDPDSKVTIPKSPDFSLMSSQLTYELTEKDPEDAIARIDYHWGDKEIGSSYLKLKLVNREAITLPLADVTQNAETDTAPPDTAVQNPDMNTLQPDTVPQNQAAETAPPDAGNLDIDTGDTFRIPSIVWTILAVLAAVLLVGLFVLLKMRQTKKEEEARMLRRQRRMERLGDTGISSAQFDLLMEQRRSSYTTRRSSIKRNRHGSSRFHFR